MLQGYSFAKLGARYPSAGGLLEYVARGFGDGHVTGIIAWLILAANAIVTAMVAVSFGSYASAAFADGNDGVDQGLRGPARRRDDRCSTSSVAGRRPGPDGHRLRGLGILSRLRGHDARQHRPDLLAPSGYPPLTDIVVERRADVLRVPRLRRRSPSPRRTSPNPARQLPRAMYLALGIATVDLHRRRARRVRHADRRRGDRLRRHGARGRGRADARPRRLLADEVTALFATAGRDQRRALPGRRACASRWRRPASSRRCSAGASAAARRRACSLTAVVAIVLAAGFDLSSIASIGSAIALLVFTLVSVGHFRVRVRPAPTSICWCWPIATTVVVLVTFAFTTLVDEPATAMAIAVILLLSVGLDLVTKRHSTATAQEADPLPRRRRCSPL